MTARQMRAAAITSEDALSHVDGGNHVTGEIASAAGGLMIVVLFATTPREDIDVEDYLRTSARLRELVAAVPGFISYNTYTADSGEGIAVVRFESPEGLEAWRIQAEHAEAQEKGRSAYYREYWVQVCSTLREYRFVAPGYLHDLAPMFAARSVIQRRGATQAPGTVA